MTFSNLTLNVGGVLNYGWQWGDGTSNNVALATNLTHTFTGAGTYDVTLTAGGTDGTNSHTRPAYVTVTAVVVPAGPVTFRGILSR